MKRSSSRTKRPKKPPSRFSLADVRRRCSVEFYELVEEARELIRETVPEVEERFYSQGKGIGYHVRGAGMLCAIFIERNGVAVVFPFGALMRDPDRVLEGHTKQLRWVMLKPGNPVPREELSRLILSALVS